jgi:hypothetical protein
MKSFAELFKVTMFGLKADQSDREEMRLLPALPEMRHPILTRSVNEAMV